MRLLADGPTDRAVGLESQPLDPVWMLGEIGYPHPGRLDKHLAVLGLICDETDMGEFHWTLRRNGEAVNRGRDGPWSLCRRTPYVPATS